MALISDAQTNIRSRDGFGVASVILAVTSIVAFILLSVYATSFNRTESANSLIGQFLVFIWVINIFGMSFAIAGIVCRPSREALPVLGLAINVGLMSLTIVLIVIGYHLR
jgi:hypothetical protein